MPSSLLERLRSSLPGTAWPAVTRGGASQLLALLDLLGQTEWWSPEELRAGQAHQLRGLAEHARATVP